MKCPKCGYLGFETSDRCRNCGYDFSLADNFDPGAASTPVRLPRWGPRSTPRSFDPEASAPRSFDPARSASDAFDLPIDQSAEPLIPSPDAAAGSRPTLDLDRIIGGSRTVTPSDLPLFPPSQAEMDYQPASARRAEAAGGGGGDPADLAPLITAPSRPRAPLGVRRATPEVPRARIRAARSSGQAGSQMLFEAPPASRFESRLADDRRTTGDAPATPSSRITAALLDFTLLVALDAAVLYFTLRLLGLTPSQMPQLPIVPLAAFLLLLNGGYFIAFTAVGGQSIGKMAMGIKVITQEDSGVPIGRATLRTLAYLVSALPLGAGFLPGVLSADGLALHDRLAHTRVVRPS